MYFHTLWKKPNWKQAFAKPPQLFHQLPIHALTTLRTGKLYANTYKLLLHQQVPLLSLLFLVLAVMNTTTLFTVLYKKPPKQDKVEKYKSL